MNDSAFPVTGLQVGVVKGGLTKLEYFAGLALQGIISSTRDPENQTGNFMSEATVAAVDYAERLLAALDEAEEIGA